MYKNWFAIKDTLFIMISTRITEEKTTYISSDEETYSMKIPNVFPSIKHASLDVERYESFNTQNSMSGKIENDFESIMGTIKCKQNADRSVKNSAKKSLRQQILSLIH